MKKLNVYTIKKEKTDFPTVKIESSKQASDFIRQFYGDDLLVFESVFILLLDRSNKTIGYAKISQGGICSAIMDVKIICKYIVDTLASGVIIAHNHPSGNCVPSQSDIDITEKLKEAVKLVDSQFLDHIILTEDEYYSFQDNDKF
jgi:DNA repair protein RadC